MRCEDFRSTLLSWFGAAVECHQESPESLIVTLPIARPNGDFIELGIKTIDPSSWRISDLGDTYESLYLGGVDLFDESDKRDEFNQIVADHGLSDQGNELSRVSKGDLAENIFDFVSAINSVLALQLTVSTKLPSRDFSSVVAKFLAEQHASFEIPTDKIPGKSGSWKFNFSLNHLHPETLVKTITASNSTNAMKQTQSTVFEVSDIREVRSSLDALVIIDDEGDRKDFWKQSALRVFRQYDIPVIAFNAERDRLLTLTAKYSLGEH
jgi:hypothetical protein